LGFSPLFLEYVFAFLTIFLGFIKKEVEEISFFQMILITYIQHF